MAFGYGLNNYFPPHLCKNVTIFPGSKLDDVIEISILLEKNLLEKWLHDREIRGVAKFMVEMARPAFAGCGFLIVPSLM